VRVKPACQSHLAVVLPGEDHHVAGPIVQELAKRIVARVDDRLPRGRALGPPIEGLDQRQELGELAAAAGRVGRPGVHRDLVAHERMALAQRQRSVEMPGLEEHQCVHCRDDPRRR